MLASLAAQLEKGAAHAREHGRDPDTLLAARLADDMYPLAGQIRITCRQVSEAIARLTGQAVPEPGEDPIDLAAAQVLIARTRAELDALAPGALERDPDRPLSVTIGTGMTFDMTAATYARDWALAQFYFHLMAAYAILRNQGVELGKRDYVGHMFAYLRAQPDPAA